MQTESSTSGAKLVEMHLSFGVLAGWRARRGGTHPLAMSRALCCCRPWYRIGAYLVGMLAAIVWLRYREKILLTGKDHTLSTC